MICCRVRPKVSTTASDSLATGRSSWWWYKLKNSFDQLFVGSQLVVQVEK